MTTELYRVWKFLQADGNPAEAPIADFEGGLDEFRAKYPNAASLNGSKDNGLSVSYTIQKDDGTGWKPCGYPGN